MAHQLPVVWDFFLRCRSGRNLRCITYVAVDVGQHKETPVRELVAVHIRNVLIDHFAHGRLGRAAAENEEKEMRRVFWIFSVYSDDVFDLSDLQRQVVGYIKAMLVSDNNLLKTEANWKRALLYVEKYFITNVRVMNKKSMEQSILPAALPFAQLAHIVGDC